MSAAAVIQADTWGSEHPVALIEARLREGAAQALRRDPSQVGALVYRSRGRDGVAGWRASVSTRDGRVYARCWATKPENAAQLLISTLSGEG